LIFIICLGVFFYKVITISDKQLSILLILNFVTVYFFYYVIK